ncbi:MAG: RsfS/YbeB/iojap family protein, partial [Elusimicrobia bacterium]|nr:RsfS/YbeB/iojap family protein [Elusimicrobiota bacterium]
NWNPFTTLDALTRYARTATGATPNGFCSGDEPNSGLRQGAETATVTSFGLRGPIDTMQPSVYRDGMRSKNWQVLDYGGVMVHVFDAKAAEFYSIEQLYANDKLVAWEEKPQTAPAEKTAAVKPAVKKPTAKKPAAKKPAAKKAAAKKPAAKKAAVKKPAAKKAAAKKPAARKPAAKKPAVKKPAGKKAPVKKAAAKKSKPAKKTSRKK